MISQESVNLKEKVKNSIKKERCFLIHISAILCKTGNFGPSTVVGDSINIMKTTLELNFDFYQALNSMDTQKYENKDKLSI